MREKEIWEILQIEPTASKREIRKAYAGLVKACHPEEAPEEFEKLNAAYQEALSRAEQEAFSTAEQEMTLPKQTSGSMQEEYAKTPETDEWRERKETDRKIQGPRQETVESVPEKKGLQSRILEREQNLGPWLEELIAIVEEYEYYDDFVIPPVRIPKDITCIREAYAEREELRERVTKLFEQPEAEQFCYENEVLEYLISGIDCVIFPRILVERLYECYAKDVSLLVGEKPQALLDYVMRLLSFYRRLPEYNCRETFSYEGASVACVCAEHPDFWEYYLAYGFGCRHEWGEKRRTLTGYIEEIYRPSLEWRKRFTGYQKTGDFIPAELSFSLQDGTVIKLEFHLHYVLYYMNGELCTRIFSFSELCQEAETLTTEQFFFLLGMTNIEEEERYQAKDMIRKYLAGLPLYEPTLEVIAECLANDCRKPPVPENEAKRVFLTRYGEDERFCFRAQATQRKLEIKRFTAEGWESMELLSGEAKKYKGLSMEEKPEFVREKLIQLKQPEPVLLRSVPLDGMSVSKKASEIIAALKEYGRYERGARGVTAPYYPGFPWSADDLFPAVNDFFAEDAGWMTNAFVVLRLGKSECTHFKKIFAASMNIFGYDLRFQSPEFEYLYGERRRVAEGSIPEQRFLTVGRIGWAEDSAPCPITIGESGRFYSYAGGDYFMAAENFAELLTLLFDLSDVTAIDIYQGIIGVSRFDQRLDYCYTNKEFQEYLDSKEKTLPQIFTKWGL